MVYKIKSDTNKLTRNQYILRDIFLKFLIDKEHSHTFIKTMIYNAIKRIKKEMIKCTC